MSRSRRNILLIHSDQHRFDCVAVNGHRLVRTPNMDRLAREGANFTRAYTPNPVCSPARASLQTGTWGSIHKCVTIPGCEFFQPADAKLPVLTQLLADAGWWIGHVGKFHAELTGGPTDHGCHEFVSGHSYYKWREQQGLPKLAKSLFGQYDPAGADQTLLHWETDNVLRMLDERGGSSDRPFFIRWDPVDPHLPNTVPQEDQNLYAPEAIAPWNSFPDPLVNKPEVQRRTRERWNTDRWTWSEWAPVVSRYLATIDLLDRQLGRILAKLQQIGQLDNTLVVYTTDHGDMCGGHGMMDKHYCMYEDIVKVPLMMRLPGEIRAGQTCDAFVSHAIDLARTFLDVAGIPAPATFVGRNLITELSAERPQQRQDIFSQYVGTAQGMYSERMVFDGRWKYVYNAVASDELYDLQTDPGELINRISDPDCRSHVERLQLRTQQWMAEARDQLSHPLFRWDRVRW